MEEFVGEVSHSRLYPNLDVLVNRDLVEKGQINRRTNYYQITATGEEAIRERREWEDEVTDFLE
jgi:DNA-binding PadR family transcriptional regulator